MTQLTRNEALGLYAALNSYAGKTVGREFDYARGKNMNKLEFDIKYIEEKRQPLIDLDKERTVLCEEHCDKDADGKPLIVGDKYVGLEDNEEFQAAFEGLKVKLVAVETELTELGKGEIGVDLHKVKLDCFPAEGVAGYMTAFAPMVAE